MSGVSTVFVDQVTLIVAAWLNDINNTCYTVLGSAGAVPTTGAQVCTNIGAVANASALTQFGALYGNGTNQALATAAGTTGLFLGANTGAAPTFQSLPSSTPNLYVGVATGTANAIVLAGPPAVSPVMFGVSATNTGAVTINGVALSNADGTALSAGQLTINSVALVAYNTISGNKWVLLSVSQGGAVVDNSPVAALGGTPVTSYTFRSCYSWRVPGGVRFCVSMIISVIGAGTGALTITPSLPASSNGNFQGSYAITGGGITTTGACTAYIGAASNFFNIYYTPQGGGASTAVTNTNCSNGMQIIFSGEYAV